MEAEIETEAHPGAATPSHLSQARQEDQETIAWVAGESVKQLPTDLYIPPEALEVFLDTFEGPLDLLLYLIRRQNLNILDVKVAVITAQYMEYIELMQALELELAGEYLLMAAMLAEIKSRMLLPRPEADDEEDDPRAELIRRLQEYEQIKTGAERLDEVPRVERELFVAGANKPELVRQHADPDVDFREVLLAMAHVLRRAEMFTEHEIQLEPLSVRERMGNILNRVKQTSEFVPFQELFAVEEGRLGVVVTFLAIMELVRESLLEFQQAEAFAPIHVRAGTGAVQGGPLADFAAIDAQYSGQDASAEEDIS
ncbi:MAG TPA: segregation/condensation protein A [Gammaproteobacteria bacterium]|nr:segregation/condensation protein A [Gammaproteobacteria bacterium]HBK11651.1 segregation/condensation protein A [Gammaproteobacteria bacterium]|tara:strand:+ start:590 stop:1528 length:939 start_codon:yes stop_codon:yes gene_type:complete